MNTILRSSLILLALSSLALAQSAPKKSQSNSAKPQNAAATPATSGANGAGQHDAATNKNQGSGSHTGNMIGNHKDVMETVDKNPSSGSHTGNHKDPIGTAAGPSAAGKNSPAAQPTPTKSPNSSH
jgi:hypothetical protein